MKNLLTMFIFIVAYNNIFSQLNLVPNPAFEDHTLCPTAVEQYDGYVNLWYNPSVCTGPRATPDYYNACGAPAVSVPTSFCETLPDHSAGQAYTGIVSLYEFLMSGTWRHGWSEYIEIQLAQPLVLGRSYTLSYFVAFNSQANISTDIGYIVSTTPITQTCADAIPQPPLWDATRRSGTSPTAIPADDAWHLVTFEFTATSCNMQYLTLGSFPITAVNEPPVAPIPCTFPSGATNHTGYCYIDDVSLVETNPIGINFTTTSQFICLASTPTFSVTMTPTITGGPFDRFEWYQDGILIAGATGTSYTTTEPGVYEIHGIVNDGTPCPTVYSATYSIYTSGSAFTLDYLPTLCNKDQTFTISFPASIVPTPIVTWTATNATNPTGSGFTYTPHFIDDHLSSDVTLTIDYGGGCIYQTTLTIYSCCYIDPILLWQNSSSSALLSALDVDGDHILGNDDGYSSRTTYFDGTFTVDADITMDVYELHMLPLSQIIINPGKTLTLKHANLFANCAVMWKGILLKDKTAHLVMSDNCTIEDAIEGINSTNGGVYDIINTTFNRCYKAIKVNRYPFIHTGNVRNTNIICQPSLLTGHTTPATLFRPYLGQITYNGIDVDRVKDIIIGVAGSSNTFDNMNCAIKTYNTRATIVNNLISNIYTISGDVNTGTAIIMNGTNDAYAFGLGVSLVGTIAIADRNTISTSTGGIHASGLFCDITNNSITNTFKGISIVNTNTWSNTPILIDHNIITNTFQVFAFTGTGVIDNNNLFTIMNITNNSISNPSISGIYSNTLGIWSNTPSGSGSANREINNNVITQMFRGISGTRIGGRSFISENTITMNTVSVVGNGIGVELISSGGTTVECNTINCTSRIKDVGIFFTTSQGNIVRCNNTSKGMNGLRISGNCTMLNSIYGNTFSEHQDYIFLTNSGIVGNQFIAGSSTSLIANSFLNTVGSRSRIRTSNATNGGLSPFKYNPAAAFVVYSPLPSSTDGVAGATAVLTLLSTVTSHYTCPSPCVSGGFAMRMTSDPDATQQAIQTASTEIELSDIPEQAYEAQRGLYKDLKNDPDKYESNAELDDFKTDFETKDAYKLMEANQDIAEKDYEAALDKTQEVAAMSMLPEMLMKEVLLWQADTSNPDSSTLKYRALMDIALTCPTIGGEAVFIARSMLMTYFSYIPWDDDIICNPTSSDYTGARRANPAGTQINTSTTYLKKNYVDRVLSSPNSGDLLIYPNPTSDQLYIHNLFESEIIKVSFINAGGQTVKSYELGAESRFISFVLDDLAKGLYLIQISFEDGSTKLNKLELK